MKDAVPEARFDVVLHPLPAGTVPGSPYVDARGSWPTVRLPVPRDGRTFSVGFDEALARFDRLGRAFIEPDGSFVWVGPGGEGRWQVDGNAWERSGNVASVEARGRCPVEELARFLDVWRERGEGLAVELVRAGVCLDEATFLRHAVAPSADADGAGGGNCAGSRG